MRRKKSNYYKIVEPPPHGNAISVIYKKARENDAL